MAFQVTCCECGEVFWLLDETALVLKRSLNSFFCPFGHDIHFIDRTMGGDDPDPGEEVDETHGLQVIKGGKT